MHGQATSYDGGDVDGTCMFATAGYTLPMGIYGAALSVDNWDTSAYCGACVSVTGQDGKSVKLMVSSAQTLSLSCDTDFSRLLINVLVTAV